jgi:TrmH family RNA methyltransferase
LVAAAAATDLFNPHAIRASMGAVFKPNVAAADVPTTLAWLQGIEVPLVAAVVDAPMTYDQFDYRGGAAIVLGSEAEGLSPAWRTAQVTGVRLPMLGVADSLNVSAAAAVLFYEARRQRSL